MHRIECEKDKEKIRRDLRKQRMNELGRGNVGGWTGVTEGERKGERRNEREEQFDWEKRNGR